MTTLGKIKNINEHLSLICCSLFPNQVLKPETLHKLCKNFSIEIWTGALTNEGYSAFKDTV